MEGKTSTGFKFKIEDEALDDYELLEALAEVDKGNGGKIVDAINLLFSEDMKQKLKEHCKTKQGRVSSSQMIQEVFEMLQGGNEESKNS